jgi:hypothetical protein
MLLGPIAVGVVIMAMYLSAVAPLLSAIVIVIVSVLLALAIDAE